MSYSWKGLQAKVEQLNCKVDKMACQTADAFRPIITNPQAGDIIAYNGEYWLNTPNTGGTAVPLVSTYADLPDPSTVPGAVYGVINSSGIPYITAVFGGSYYSKGFYYSTGSTWEYMGSFPVQASQDEVNAGIVTNKFVSPATLNGYTPQMTVNSIAPSDPDVNDLWIQI